MVSVAEQTYVQDTEIQPAGFIFTRVKRVCGIKKQHYLGKDIQGKLSIMDYKNMMLEINECVLFLTEYFEIIKCCFLIKS